MYNEELKLEILRKASGIVSQRDLADELGCSVGKINYIINALIDKGLIKVQKFASSEKKKKYVYLLTRNGLTEKIELTQKFIELKKKEYNELQSELDEYHKCLNDNKKNK
mgnify:CR=1 FL=1